MITKVTAKNSDEYKELFKKAEELIHKEIGEDILIKNLYEYFIVFPTILAAAEKKDSKESNETGDSEYWQKYFTILPLDEPVFEINADTRVINVPTQFKNIGVVGDNVAEIIFFSIDRFFDAVDFGAKEIQAVIEWHRISGNNQDTYVDNAYIKELTLKDNKVLIGWGIDERVTEEPGTIEFAVRLIGRDENNKINYSFSTQAAKVNINKTLNFYPDITEVDNSAVNQVLSRILSSTSPDMSNPNASPPIYEEYEKDESGEIIKIISTNIDAMDAVHQYVFENEFYADLDENTNSFTTFVKAISVEGNDTLLYRWYKYNQQENIWNVYPEGAKEATDGNIIDIKDTGKFKCVAIDYFKSRRATKDSQILYILEPEKPEVKVADEGKYFSVILKDETNGEKLEVIPKNGNAFSSTIYDANKRTNTTFEWKSNDNVNDEDKVDIEGENEIEYFAKDEGYYYGYAKTQRNGIVKISNEATTYRVTRPLYMPTSTYTISGLSDNNSCRGKVGQEITIDFNVYKEDGTVDKSYAYDTILYHWYRATSDLVKDEDYKKIEDDDGAYGKVNVGGKIKFKPRSNSPAAYRVKLLIKRNRETIPEKDIDENDPSTWYTLDYMQTNGETNELTISLAAEN